MLRKIKRDQANGIVVVPLWKNQPWFPLFQSLLISEPLEFQPNVKLLCYSNRQPHPLWKSLILVAARLSAQPY
ncbi:hypothetical protein TKK_0018080 [Trichogramma kaykai]